MVKDHRKVLEEHVKATEAEQEDEEEKGKEAGHEYEE